ncbi:GntR family transcriptional regulator [Murimonas intestini]|uniref:GntR family transcriptional regulator n=1 Tax=Murimonas intestini TaxID=1337051 RepID=A0AB73T0S8_9FIRM|nr:GntR family transcriptional regulator [Murimonas intestini]MCR1867660.1 GntR family transcriptional regulator [Murimonas intestini]MCR1884925.1 GntR family transcriptional regulator [Murimonas intestini]
MKIDFEDERPIFQQIALGIEDAILTGAFEEEEQIPSITEFSVTYKINPATALKGINLLVDAGVLYKKRGVGMFVTEGAVMKLKEKRKEEFYDSYVRSLIEEAKKLGISGDEIIAMVARGYER